MIEFPIPVSGEIPRSGGAYALTPNWDSVIEDFKANGTILGYPALGTNMTVVLYNRKLVSAAGLDFDAHPPRTTVQFDAALQKIRDTGVLPIASDMSQRHDLINMVNNYWWGEITSSADLVRENKGELKYVDDQGLRQALTYLKSWYQKGFMNQDVLS